MSRELHCNWQNSAWCRTHPTTVCHLRCPSALLNGTLQTDTHSPATGTNGGQWESKAFAESWSEWLRDIWGPTGRQTRVQAKLCVLTLTVTKERNTDLTFYLIVHWKSLALTGSHSIVPPSHPCSISHLDQRAPQRTQMPGMHTGAPTGNWAPAMCLLGTGKALPSASPESRNDLPHRMGESTGPQGRGGRAQIQTPEYHSIPTVVGVQRTDRIQITPSLMRFHWSYTDSGDTMFKL
jgi:hypothetical protein